MTSNTTVLIELSAGLESSEVKMFGNLLNRMRQMVVFSVAVADRTIVTDGAVFLSNKLLMGAEG